MRQTIFTENAPKPIGAYEQGIIVDDTIYLSGQIGLDPKTNHIVSGGIEPETTQVLNNIKAILTSIHTNMDQIVKATIFLADINDMVKVNDIYQKYFNGHYPARSAFQVAALPKNAKNRMYSKND